MVTATILIYGGLILLMALAVLQRPARALGPMLCLYGLKQWAMSNSPYFVVHRTTPNLHIGGIVGAGVLMSFLRHRLSVGKYPKAGWFFLALLAMAAFSFFWTVERTKFIEQWNLNWYYFVTFVFFAPFLIVDMDDLRTALNSIIFFGSITMMLLLFMTNWKWRFVEFTGYYGYKLDVQSNPLAIAHLSAYVMLGVVLMNFRGIDRFWQAARWFLIALGLVMMVKAQARGPLFMVLIVLVAFLPMSRPIKNVAGFLTTSLSFAIIGAIVLVVFSTYAAQKRWSWDVMSNDSGWRIDTSLRVLKYWAAQGPITWLIGIGNSGSFNTKVHGWYPEVVAAEVLAEEGLIGFTLWLMMSIYTFKNIARTFRILRPYPQERGYLAAISAMFVFEFVLSFKGGSLLTNTNVLIFLLVLARYADAVERAAAAPPVLVDEYDVEPMPELAYSGVGI